ncbi:MAG: alpha/beta fold hydrolase [Gammaproteobacteria bacterium]|nr:MAG: alpha/beta fold hydrolase [Gammaproteobacteria bacterium]
MTETEAARRVPVVLVHGIWMTGVELMPLAHTLRRAGFEPHVFHYPSLRRPLAWSADRLDRYIAGLGSEQVHLLGHSLGGLLLVHLFDRHPAQPPGRVLMLGSPIRGSGVARSVSRRQLLRPLLGHATDHALLGDLPPWRGDRPVAMIAGTRGVGVGNLLGGLQPPHDGTVSLSETKADWLDAHLSVPHSHFGMLLAPEVHRAAIRWFREGVLAS